MFGFEFCELGRPPPPCWEEFPNNHVFFFERVPYQVHLCQIVFTSLEIHVEDAMQLTRIFQLAEKLEECGWKDQASLFIFIQMKWIDHATSHLVEVYQTGLSIWGWGYSNP